jgi:hypothetical protein
MDEVDALDENNALLSSFVRSLLMCSEYMFTSISSTSEEESDFDDARMLVMRGEKVGGESLSLGTFEPLLESAVKFGDSL